MKIELKYPITLPKTVDRPESELKELILVDRMQAKHAKLIPDDCFQGDGKVSPTKFLPCIASMAGIPVESAENLDFVDLVKIVGEIMMPFLSELGSQEEQQKK